MIQVCSPTERTVVECTSSVTKYEMAQDLLVAKEKLCVANEKLRVAMEEQRVAEVLYIYARDTLGLICITRCAVLPLIV